MTERFIYRLTSKNLPNLIGNKARNLHNLSKYGYRIPVTHVCTWNAYLESIQGHEQVVETLRLELEEVLDLTQTYSVRSSANIEDGLDHAFAGQFTSVLDVHGLDELLMGIQEVWNSARASRLVSYLNKIGHDARDVKMAVVIQEMVSPVVSGVSFSKNPLTGLNEVIVEAVSGRGDALLQDGINPNRWVYKGGNWIVEPEDTEVEISLVREVAELTMAIASANGEAVDLEWVYDGQHIYWLQLRNISTLKNLKIYSNRISREVLPGIIKPLVWSVNVPLVNSAWIELFTKLIGPNELQPEDLTKAFYYRAYFNTSAIGTIFRALGIPEESLEILMGITESEERPNFRPSRRALRHLPRITSFLLEKWGYDRRIRLFLPHLRQTYRLIAQRPLEDIDESQLLMEIDQLFTLTQKVAYANIVVPLMMYIYNALLRRQLVKVGIPFDQFDLMHDVDELSDYDPSSHLARLNGQYLQLDADLQEQIRGSGYKALIKVSEESDFHRGTIDFMNRFGHFSDSGNDFSCQTWRESPDLVLQMITGYQESEVKMEKISWADLQLNPWTRQMLRPIYRRARNFRLNREAVSYWYTYGYGLFRNFFLELGLRFAIRGLINEPDDIFYIYLDEVRQLVKDSASAAPQEEVIAARKADMAAQQDLALPEIIYGDQPPPPEKQMTGYGTLKGIPTSSGYYKGRVKVVRKIQEFNKLNEGEVLVIPYSDVSWTPLFTKAGAVIAEAGGMLSHSSIIAREYGLPAIVSVSDATLRLKDGMQVTVDGYTGDVILHQGEDSETKGELNA